MPTSIWRILKVVKRLIVYVIYAFGSMLSCILCERQKFSESHKLKRFGDWNQFRAARFVTILIIARSINAMKRVVKI